MIQIKRNNANLLAVDNPLSSSNYSKAVMGEEQITLVWEQPTFLQLNIGDYIVYEGSNFTMNQIPTVKKLSTRVYQYNAVFQSTKYELSKAMYMLFDNTDTVPLDEFPLTGTAETFMQLLIDNLNRVAGAATWSLGDVIPGTEYKNLTFSDEDCLTVLGRLADEFATEYHVINHTIHLKKISTDREITLQYGSTLYDIERSSVNSSDIVTRLYVFGSSKNIAANYRGGSTKLLLPAPDTYLQHANAALYGIIEQSKTFEDIYPRLSSGAAGTVTSVGNEFAFTDSHLDFNVNDCLLDGTKAKVRFNTGECAGYDFEIASYNNTTKTYVIIANTGEKDFTLPTTDLKPAVGDKYILIDLVMPANYVTSGELEVKDKGLEYLNSNATPKVNYKATFSAVYAKQHVQNIECGDTVPVVDTNIGINERLRIVKITKGLTDFYNVQFDLSNTVTKTTLQRIAGDVANVTNQVVVTNDQVNKNRLQAYQNTREVKDMVFDPDGYFDTQKIKPASIETGMLSVGTKSQSFQLACTLQPNYLNNPQVITWSAGTLAHFTLVDDQIKEWVISEGSLTIATQYASSAMYIYARCSRTGTTGDIYFSTTATKFDADGTNWMLLIGLLHTPINGVRGISLSYGETTINGANIKTGVISGGGLEINMTNGSIKGYVQFKSGETYKEVGAGIADAKSEAVQLASNDATTKANTAKDTAISTASADATNKANAAYLEAKNYADVVGADKQSQIDGQIISWFRQVDALLTNSPASEWTIETLRNQHANDTYTNTSNGKCWRFQYNGSTSAWEWGVIADTATQQALTAAGTATAIANGKRTVFDSQPTTPYLAADLWLNNGDLYSCITARSSGSFVSGDWVKAVKYTDDTAVNNLVISTRNLVLNSGSEVCGNGHSWSSVILRRGKSYCGTVMAKSDRNIAANIYFLDSVTGSFASAGITLTTTYQQFSIRGVCPNWWNEGTGILIIYQSNGSIPIWTKEVSVVEGDKPMLAWEEAPEDVAADATSKANAAQTAAISTAALAAQAKADLAELNAKAHADGIVTAEEQRAINDATTKANNAQTAAINAAAADATAKANAAQTAAISTAALAAQAKADLAELNAKAHADGIVTAEEQRAINDATTKSNNAQTAAINAAAADATAKANAAQTAAISTAAAAAQAKADLAELNAKAHADGIVTAEEQRAINDATTKANNAQTAAINAAAADATAKANAATAVANTAQSTIDNLNISTKNLVSGDGSEILVYGYVTYGALMKRGKEYCGTVMAKSDRTVSPNLYFLDSVTGSFASAGITLTNTYQQFSIRGICPNWWNEATGILILYQSDFSIPIWTKEVSVVEGGKPMLAWMASPEYTTIKIDEAKAKAMEADYLKSALQSSSEANGGLFSTTLIQVRDTDNVVKGGMSGVQNDNVGIWTGGTYADAIAGIAKNIFNKNGNFRIGGGLIDFDVASQIMLISALIRTAVSGDRLEISNSNNSITIYDYAGLEKVKISPKTVSPRGEIGGSTTVTTTTYAAHANTIDEDGTATIGSTETITLDPTKFFTIVTPAVNFSLSASGDYDGINKIHYTGDASVRVSLFDVSKGVSVWESNESVSSSNSSVSEDSGTIGAKTLTGMKGSIYRIDVTISISHEGAGTGLASASISAGQTLTGTIVNTISEIGLNGFNFIKSADEWLHLGDDEFSRRGATDLPGVLATGSVNSSGGLSNEWGAKKRASNVWVTKGGTGIYNVPHQAGSTYSVQITSTTDNLNARVTSRGTNTFQVTVRNMSGTAVDTGSFDFTLYGAN